MKGSTRDVSLYVHFPYCKMRCTYCDFNTYVVENIPNQSYTDAILREGDIRAPTYGPSRLTSIYFGGGTPSLWGSAAISRLIKHAKQWFTETNEALEITLECNPEEASLEQLNQYAEVGVTRLSLGVQSLQDPVLQTIGRRHSAQRARDAVNTALSVGFQSVSVDLMFGLPGQSIRAWTEDLKTIANTGVPHLSLYHLTLEPGTAMTRDVRTQRLHLPSEEHQDEMWDLVHPACSEFGLLPYEISNLASPGHESHHNISYWMGTPYLGLGAGAHSFKAPTNWVTEGASGIRSMGIKKPQSYMSQLLNDDASPEWHEDIDPMTHLRERMFTGLRYLPGFSMKKIAADLGMNPVEVFSDELTSLSKEKLVTINDDWIQLTRQGLRLANDVFLRFF